MSLEDTLRDPTAAGVFAAVPKIVEQMEARPGDEASLDFLHRLVDGKTPEEAMTFAAHMLQPRLSVWWGHECLHSARDLLTEHDEEMLELAATWVGDPSEENRYAAMDAAMAAADKTPGTWIALGAGWSGGSLGPAEFDAVPPDPLLCGHAVNIATLTLLARVPLEKRAKRLRGFVQMAEALATSG